MNPKIVKVPAFLQALGLAALTACHPGPVINTEPALQVGGTIAGFVRATNGSVPLVTRKVTAINTGTGERYDTTTGLTGGYTLKVPRQGTYRIEVELRDGEAIAKAPDETQVNNGDLDPDRNFEITVKK
jgi:hypothetical protein